MKRTILFSTKKKILETKKKINNFFGKFFEFSQIVQYYSSLSNTPNSIIILC